MNERLLLCELRLSSYLKGNNKCHYIYNRIRMQNHQMFLPMTSNLMLL